MYRHSRSVSAHEQTSCSTLYPAAAKFRMRNGYCCTYRSREARDILASPRKTFGPPATLGVSLT
jgi:hypothetical protein